MAAEDGGVGSRGGGERVNGWGEIAALAPCILGSDRGGGGPSSLLCGFQGRFKFSWLYSLRRGEVAFKVQICEFFFFLSDVGNWNSGKLEL